MCRHTSNIPDRLSSFRLCIIRRICCFANHLATHSTSVNTATHCNTLQHTATVYYTPHLLLCKSPGNTQCCSVLQCVAVCCSMLQCVAVCCSVAVYYTPHLLLCKSPGNTQHISKKSCVSKESCISKFFCPDEGIM